MNNSSTSQNTLYYLQKDLDGINIPITTLRHTGGRLRFIKGNNIKKMNPSRKEVKKIETKRTE